MPLVRIDTPEGRSDSEIRTLLDASHRAVVKAFNVHPRDKYQIYCKHNHKRIVAEDTGLNIPRTDNVTTFTIGLIILLGIVPAPVDHARYQVIIIHNNVTDQLSCNPLQ